VIVPSVNGRGDLLGALDALAVNAREVSLEIIVADRCGEPLRAEVRQRFPTVRVLDAAPGTSIPQLRAAAIEASRAPAVAVIEDHVIVPPGWARALLARLELGEQVVGGGVVNLATARLVDRAAYLCEYSHLLPPLPFGPSSWVTGNNTLYLRSLVAPHLALVAENWENALHDQLRRDGVTLFLRPEIVVGHQKHYTVREYASQRYLYSRSYAGVRFESRPLMIRLAAGAAALALPPVLLARIVRRVWTKGQFRSALAAMPLLAVFVCAWSAGEAVGAWAGKGNALSRIC
jgi:hypothetical protein